ncbi:PAS domain S-box-containing protein [Stackebrandtia albiflava]|uniref:PAS domain S-box-containing protein n=1 Tax=Stackebrandtia albiflava TaxID=406432 RepID=A0A562VB82_9ACTN|nr:SpoIIE family protein phosphatase [Stackebrandtia albiflava]TWJ15124.1 PAS domain S-box-containing protein [Stackebrandtia albiflava]
MSQSFGAMFSGDLTIATIVVDADRRISYFGSAAEELTGFRRSDVVGRDIQVILSTAAADGKDYPIGKPTGHPEVHQIRRADGSTRAVITYRHPIPQPSGPPATLVLGIDVAESRETEMGLGLLNAFFRQATFGFAILDNQLRFVALNEALARINRRPVIDHLGRPIEEVIESPDMATYRALLRAVMETGEPVQDLHIPGHPSTAPDASTVWAVSWYRLTDTPGRPFGLCGVVMDVTESQHPTLDDGRNRDRLALLSAVGAKVGNTLDFRETAQDLAELLVTDYADIVMVDVVHTVISGEEPDDFIDEETLVSRIGGAARETSTHTEKILRVASPRRAAETNAFAQVLNSNQPQLSNDPLLSESMALTGERRDAADAAGLASVIVAPLRARDVTLGVLTCIRLVGRGPYDDDDLLLVQEIANRTALSIDNSRLYRDEKQAALTLQLSLLPQRLPDLAEARLTYRYQPNRANLRAAGDWFDTVVLPGRRIAMVVGDVAGHGIHSAAAMGHYRTAVRSLASIGLDPAMLLTRLNDLAMDFSGDVTATCVYVLYDPVEHWCAMASAGHPPPVLSLPDQPPQAKEIAGGPLLGALPGAEYQSTAMATPPGTRLLLYTDGLVESRSTKFDEGVEHLVRLMRTRRPAGELCDQLMAESPSSEDDRTVLLAEFKGLSPHLRPPRAAGQ